VSNISLSIFEDLSVAGLMALALAYPVATVIVVAALVVAAAALTLWLFRIMRRASRAVRKRFGAIRART
jgi:multisubunit Na+/H+ antiporter MnhC subunit